MSKKEKSPLKYIERIILKEEMKKLERGDHITIAVFRHKFKNCELKGYLKRIE